MITHCSFYLFSIWHVYGHASLLRWVYVLERVPMGASLWDSILVYVLGDSMSCLFVFCERDERPFFRISGSLLYSSSHLFRMWLLSMLWYRWPSLTFYLFAFFYLRSIPIFHHTSSDFFLFSSCLMFDLGSESTLYSCLFNVSIPLLSLFMWGPLGPGFMTFSMHCISCMKGMGIISLGSLSLVSFRFVHPITLAYVTSHVLRPP